MVLGEFPGVWAWGLFFCGMNGGRDERTDSLPAGWGIGAALDVGGVSFLRFVVRGLGNRGWFGYIVVFLCNI